MAANPVIGEILRQGRRLPVDRRTRRRRIKAALETGRVESNFTNPAGGDADSVNWRQERRSIYGGDMSIRRSVMRFYNEAAQQDRGQKSYQLAADVQRPRADLRGRYRTASREAGAILHGGGGADAGATGTYQPGRVQLGTRQSFDQAGFDQAERRAKVGAFLAQRHGTGGILFRTGLLSTTAPDRQDFTSSRLTSKVIPGHLIGDAAAAAGGGQVRQAVHEAQKRLGVSEVNGSNRGAVLDKWERRFGTIGAPWCGIYAGVVLKKAGVRGVNSRIASVQAIEDDARSSRGPFRGWHSPAHARAGDLLVTAKGQHVVVVTGRDRRGRIRAIGGNTGNGALERRTYDPSQVYGVARPRYRRG